MVEGGRNKDNERNLKGNTAKRIKTKPAPAPRKPGKFTAAATLLSKLMGQSHSTHLYILCFLLVSLPWNTPEQSNLSPDKTK